MIRGMDTNSLELNPSPSLTPWGSRSASPYATPDTNEFADETVSGPDMEVLQVTSGFCPIPSMETNLETPSDSPTQGILPVGGVVRGHALPGLKSDHFARVKLQKDLTAIGSFKAFVDTEPNSKKLLYPKCETEKEEREEPSEVKMDDSKKPPGVKVEGARVLSGVKMVSAKEPSEVKMDGARDPSGVKMADAKEPTGRNMEEITAENKTEKRSSWYIVEKANQDSGNVENIEKCKDKPTVIHEQSSLSTETKSEETVTGKEKAVATAAVKAKPFSRGHRRVASSPPMITVSSVDNKLFSGQEDISGGTYLERSRSDSDLSAHAKHNDSQVSKYILTLSDGW